MLGRPRRFRSPRGAPRLDPHRSLPRAARRPRRPAAGRSDDQEVVRGPSRRRSRSRSAGSSRQGRHHSRRRRPPTRRRLVMDVPVAHRVTSRFRAWPLALAVAVSLHARLRVRPRAHRHAASRSRRTEDGARRLAEETVIDHGAARDVRGSRTRGGCDGAAPAAAGPCRGAGRPRNARSGCARPRERPPSPRRRAALA